MTRRGDEMTSLLDRVNKEVGFTITELLVACAIMFVMASIALPELSSFRGQMQASEDIRRLSGVLSELRSEAIRLKANVRVSFTDTGYSWDIFDDSSDDGNITLSQNSVWGGADVPDDIVFNGLGLIRSMASDETTIKLQNRESEMQLTVNTNGYIEL